MYIVHSSMANIKKQSSMVTNELLVRLYEYCDMSKKKPSRCTPSSPTPLLLRRRLLPLVDDFFREFDIFTKRQVP